MFGALWLRWRKKIKRGFPTMDVVPSSSLRRLAHSGSITCVYLSDVCLNFSTVYFSRDGTTMRFGLIIALNRRGLLQTPRWARPHPKDVYFNIRQSWAKDLGLLNVLFITLLMDGGRGSRAGNLRALKPTQKRLTSTQQRESTFLGQFLLKTRPRMYRRPTYICSLSWQL